MHLINAIQTLTFLFDRFPPSLVKKAADSLNLFTKTAGKAHF